MVKAALGIRKTCRCIIYCLLLCLTFTSVIFCSVTSKTFEWNIELAGELTGFDMSNDDEVILLSSYDDDVTHVYLIDRDGNQSELFSTQSKLLCATMNNENTRIAAVVMEEYESDEYSGDLERLVELDFSGSLFHSVYSTGCPYYINDNTIITPFWRGYITTMLYDKTTKKETLYDVGDIKKNIPEDYELSAQRDLMAVRRTNSVAIYNADGMMLSNIKKPYDDIAFAGNGCCLAGAKYGISVWLSPNDRDAPYIDIYDSAGRHLCGMKISNNINASHINHDGTKYLMVAPKYVIMNDSVCSNVWRYDIIEEKLAVISSAMSKDGRFTALALSSEGDEGYDIIVLSESGVLAWGTKINKRIREMLFSRDNSALIVTVDGGVYYYNND